MNISYNWLRQYIDIDFDVQTLSEKLTQAGLEVEEVYPYSNVPELSAGLVIGQVMECDKHPNADKLSLTKVNIAGPELLSIVCGAPNVAAGQMVIVATVGTELHPTGGEPFVIKKSKIRGEASEGMICAEDEIGLGQSHAGIIVLPEDAPVGTAFKDYMKAYRDSIIEIGLTPNRVDAASHIGVARDVAALLGKKIKYPAVDLRLNNSAAPTLSIEIKDTEACPRYSGILIRGVQVGESPEWLRNYLEAVGLKPINNIVDVTNFVMYEMGQPLHAFDLDEIKGNRIIIQRAQEGSRFVTLDKAERTLNGQELMIAHAEEPMALAGVFGGLHSGITAQTKDIFIESAYFQPSVVRQTARRHGIFTDASFRFERGTDPEATIPAALRAASLVLEVAGGTVEDHLYDAYPNPIAPRRLELRWDYLNKVAGTAIPQDQAITILQSLEFRILEQHAEGLLLQVPGFKSDVTRPIDVVEEVLRIYSYDNIPFSHQVRSILQVDKSYYREQKKKQIGSYLIGNGFYEAYVLTFVNEAANAVYPERMPIALLNPLSADLAQLRNSLLVPGLRMLEHNLNRQQQNNRFFKWGMVHAVEDGQFVEHYRLGLWLTGMERMPNWHDKSRKVDLYYLKGLIENLLAMAKVEGSFQETEDERFAFAGSYMKGKRELVRFGKVDEQLLKAYGIDEEVFFADFDADMLLREKEQVQYKAISRFPRVERDLALQVPAELRYGDIRRLVQQTEHKLLRKVRIFDVYQGEQVKQGFKSYAIRLEFEDPSQTLEDKTVDKMMQRIIQALEKEMNIQIR